MIRADRFDPANIDLWLAQTDGAIGAVEQVINHSHLYDEVHGTGASRLSDLETLAQRIAAAWRDLFQVRYPDRRFTVTFTTEPDEYGPTISVHQADTCPECQPAS